MKQSLSTMENPYISSNENLNTKLLVSANKVLKKDARLSGDTTKLIFTADMIKIDKTDNESIKGYVQCVICKEMKKVSYKNCKDSWVMPNFISHFKKCSQKIANKKKEKSEEDQRSATGNLKKGKKEGENDQQSISAETKVLGSNKQEVNLFKATPEVQKTNPGTSQIYAFFSDKLIKQMSLQNIKMKNTIAKNEGIIVQRDIRANVQNILSNILIGTCQIPADGNCLFNAVAHQLYRLEIGSEQHKALIEKLRMDVVQHIENNIPAYEFILKDRIYHKNPEKKITDIEKEIKFFLKTTLSKDNRWGGGTNLFTRYQLYTEQILLFSMKMMLRI